jgi:hypothetical protein
MIAQYTALRHRLIEALVPEMNSDRKDAIVIAPLLRRRTSSGWSIKRFDQHRLTIRRRRSLLYWRVRLASMSRIGTPSNDFTTPPKQTR